MFHLLGLLLSPNYCEHVWAHIRLNTLLLYVCQVVYERMRMCRAMVNDHFTPAYLAAMTSAMAAFQAGYPARRRQQTGPQARQRHDVSAAEAAPISAGISQREGGPSRSEGGNCKPADVGHAKAA